MDSLKKKKILADGPPCTTFEIVGTLNGVWYAVIKVTPRSSLGEEIVLLR